MNLLKKLINIYFLWFNNKYLIYSVFKLSRIIIMNIIMVNYLFLKERRI